MLSRKSKIIIAIVVLASILGIGLILYFVLSKNNKPGPKPDPKPGPKPDPKPDPKPGPKPGPNPNPPFPSGHIVLNKITAAVDPVLSWSLPTDTGSSPNYGYIVDSAKIKSNNIDNEGWNVQADRIQGRTYKVKGLTPGKYFFRVRVRDHADDHDNFNTISNEVRGTVLPPQPPKNN